MSRRPDIAHKKPPEILADLLDGHRMAALDGPLNARKYLERSIDKHHSMPNGVKFFLYDLLAEAAAQTNAPEVRDHAVQQAFTYLPFAQEDLPRQAKEWLPTVRCFEVAIDAALDEGHFEAALALAEDAVGLGLGKVYEQKAESIRWMM
jgi:hypothetical protein